MSRLPWNKKQENQENKTEIEEDDIEKPPDPPIPIDTETSENSLRVGL